MSSLAFRPDDPNVLVTGSWDKTVKLWDLSTSTCLSTMRAHSNWVRAVAWSPCGQWLASGGDDRMIFIYDAKTFEFKSSLNVGYAPFSTLCGDLTAL